MSTSAPVSHFPLTAIGAGFADAVLALERIVGDREFNRVDAARDYGVIIGLFGSRERLFDTIAAFVATESTERSLASIEELVAVFSAHDSVEEGVTAVRRHLLEPLMIDGLISVLEKLEGEAKGAKVVAFPGNAGPVAPCP